MGANQDGAGSTESSAEEDPNATGVYSSPPCFLHELDPSYLGYLSREEVGVLLEAVLSARWGETVQQEAPLRAMLRQHSQALGNGPELPPAAPAPAAVSGGSGDPGERGTDRLARMIQEALPRVYDDVLRCSLGQVLDVLEHGITAKGP